MNFLPKKPKIIEEKDNRAIFEVEALYPGYGITIGNSLRRVLLSSLRGAAVTQVKIKGVQHEFSTISGVLEDVITILMNIKQMRFKLYGLEAQKAVLKVKGEKEVRGSDFDFPTQVELVNKDCHIATLTDKKASLEIEIQIEQGVGYESIEQRKKQEKLETGVLPLDAIFTPVKRVSFKVENMRVGERTDFDSLKLEVETDGTITPRQAILRACEILVNHFSSLKEPFKEKEIKRKEIKKETTSKREKKEEDIIKKGIEELNLSTGAINALSANNIKTVGGLLRKSEETLSQMEGMGNKRIKEIKKALKKLNLELK